MSLPLEHLEASLRHLVRDYQELNSSTATEVDATPTALEFAKFVAANRPLVIRGEGQRQVLPALARWTDKYLCDKLGERKVTVAVSPNGRADSVIDGYFVEPAAAQMTMHELLHSLNPTSSSSSGPVFYLQSQNGNLSPDGDLHPLAEDVGDGPAFARDIFGESLGAGPSPDVANVWIGDAQSKTSLHKDPYQNIYCVLRGTKTFTLYPPTEFACMHESLYPTASYHFTPPSTFTLHPSSPAQQTPWIPIDPLSPSLSEHPRFVYARPMKVTLNPGDMLYLPSLWYHFVEQDVGPFPFGDEVAEEGGNGVEAAVAVNWWYDMSFEGEAWSLSQFVRRMTLALDGRVEHEVEEE
ncbi:phospholipase A2 [Pseudohyphozyma bogoriensis]|nr:phospholipase A2 [Pseudohyphozyma bogoriensis]